MDSHSPGHRIFIPATLAVGTVPAQFSTGAYLIAKADRITLPLLAWLKPEVIVSSLFDPVVDVMELARRLTALNYEGRFRAITTTLPTPDLVRTEMADHAPGLDFDLWFVDGSDPGDQVPGNDNNSLRKRVALLR